MHTQLPSLTLTHSLLIKSIWNNLMKAAWWSYKNQSMEETLLNRQKTGMVESNELTLEKKLSQVQSLSLPLPGGMVFTSLLYVLKLHFPIPKMEYNNIIFYIIGIWWGLNNKPFKCLEEEILNYYSKVIELMLFWWK